MPPKFVEFPAPTGPRSARSRMEEIREAWLREHWGDEYDGQETLRDGITRYPVTIHEREDGKAAIGFDERQEKFLTDTDRGSAKTLPEMKARGWFAAEP